MSEISKSIIRSRQADEPVRLNKYLSDAGVCSRREADRLIESGQVIVDGIAAIMGQKVSRHQHIVCRGQLVRGNDDLIILAFNKPAGIECTSDLSNPDNIISYINYPSRIYPVGRLDKNSSGLILLTNTGEISDAVLRSSNFHEKEYDVKVNAPITSQFISDMKNGVDIYPDDGARKVRTRRCQIIKTGNDSFRIILTQGLKRQIRRMCNALGYKVTALKRIRIMNVKLLDLPEGSFRELSENEIIQLLERADLKK